MVVTKENMKLPPADVKKHTLLRVNREYMELYSSHGDDAAAAAPQQQADDSDDTMVGEDDSIVIDGDWANEFEDPLESGR